MSMKQIVARLQATATSDWWDGLDAEQKKAYIEDHPNSKYAKDAIADKGHDEQHSSQAPGEAHTKERKEAVSTLRKHGSKIAAKLKSTFPRMHSASAGLKNLATGKPLEDEHKEALCELGMLALNTGLSKKYGVWHAITVSQVGATAVKHAMDHFKEKKAQSPKKDDTEVFVDAVADGLENGKPASKEETRSFIKAGLGQHFKAAAKHVVAIADKSFSDVKPAVQGLKALAHGQKMDDEHKAAIKSLSKFAIGTAITYMPGGIFAHIGMSVGVVALEHAVKAIRDKKLTTGTLLTTFVAATVGSLEDSLLDAVAPE